MLAARVEQKNGMTTARQKWRDAPLTKKAPYKPYAGIAARTDLCGGREVTRVPTANVPPQGRDFRFRPINVLRATMPVTSECFTARTH